MIGIIISIVFIVATSVIIGIIFYLDSSYRTTSDFMIGSIIGFLISLTITGLIWGVIFSINDKDSKNISTPIKKTEITQQKDSANQEISKNWTALDSIKLPEW